MTTDLLAGTRGEAYERLLRQEDLILDVTERLTGALLEKQVTRAELARRLDRTPGFVSQVLAGGRNLTLRTIADIAAALSLRSSFELSPAGELRTGSVNEWTSVPEWKPGDIRNPDPIGGVAAQGSRFAYSALAA